MELQVWKEKSTGKIAFFEAKGKPEAINKEEWELVGTTTVEVKGK